MAWLYADDLEPQGRGDRGASRMGGPESTYERISIVIPCFNEEAVILATHRRLVEVLEQIPKLELELIFVDDGSRDRTLEKLRDLQRFDRRVRVLAFSRNFGRLEEASGDLNWGKPRRIESALVNDISNLDTENQVLARDSRRRSARSPPRWRRRGSS